MHMRCAWAVRGLVEEPEPARNVGRRGGSRHPVSHAAFGATPLPGEQRAARTSPAAWSGRHRHRAVRDRGNHGVARDRRDRHRTTRNGGDGIALPRAWALQVDLRRVVPRSTAPLDDHSVGGDVRELPVEPIPRGAYTPDPDLQMPSRRFERSPRVGLVPPPGRPIGWRSIAAAAEAVGADVRAEIATARGKVAMAGGGKDAPFGREAHDASPLAAAGASVPDRGAALRPAGPDARRRPPPGRTARRRRGCRASTSRRADARGHDRLVGP